MVQSPQHQILRTIIWIKDVITPIAEENKKLKEDLHTAYQKIKELNSLVLDLTTKNKNKMKETKDWVTNEVEHISATVPL